jgi:methylglutamate dehydrogenase subunit D
MLEARSPLGLNARFEPAGIVLSEAPNFTLTQVAGEDKVLKKVLGKIPALVGTALHHANRTLFRIGPKQIWVLGEALPEAAGLYITPLSSGRTRIALEGLRARDVLSSCALFDFTPSHFKSGHFVMTGIHHTPVTIHCIGENEFHIYVLRSFARNVWEWLTDIAEGLQT